MQKKFVSLNKYNALAIFKVFIYILIDLHLKFRTHQLCFSFVKEIQIISKYCPAVNVSEVSASYVT